jgi:hypothetical protein
MGGRSIHGPAGEWKAYYFYYHASLDRLLRKLVCPLVQKALAAACIDSFFFVRYRLGGPHVRLRWRVSAESGSAQTELLLRDAAEDFFSIWPSRESLPEEEILRTNREMLLAEKSSSAQEMLVMADNSWSPFPVEFEVERYGGSEHLDYSLDLFAVSSVSVLKLLKNNEHAKPNWSRMALLELYLELAWGLADGQDELRELANYALSFMGAQFGPCADDADREFAGKAPQLLAWAEHRLRQFAGEVEGGALPLLAEAAVRLRAGLEDLSPQQRWYLCASHLHMTANRMGIMNPEEVYLSRILFRVLEVLRAGKPELWMRLQSGTSRRKMDAAQRSSRKLARAAMADFLHVETTHG